MRRKRLLPGAEGKRVDATCFKKNFKLLSSKTLKKLKNALETVWRLGSDQTGGEFIALPRPTRCMDYKKVGARETRKEKKKRKREKNEMRKKKKEKKRRKTAKDGKGAISGVVANA